MGTGDEEGRAGLKIKIMKRPNLEDRVTRLVSVIDAAHNDSCAEKARPPGPGSRTPIVCPDQGKSKKSSVCNDMTFQTQLDLEMHIEKEDIKVLSLRKRKALKPEDPIVE